MLSNFSSTASGWLDEGTSGQSCTVTPTTLNFGVVNIGNSVTKQFTVENTGGEDFYVDTSFTPGSSNQLNSWDCWGYGDYTLSPGDTMTVTCEFAPDRTGPMSLAADFGTESGCDDVTCTGTGQ